MIKTEDNRIMFAIDNVEEREKRLCKKYCELNPQDKERRERDKNIYLLGLYAARQEIKKMTNIK